MSTPDLSPSFAAPAEPQPVCHDLASVTPQPLPAAPRSTGAGQPRAVTLKAIGVGGAGANIVEQMIRTGLGGVVFAVVNTGPLAIEASSAVEQVVLETERLRGLGTGGDPERGRELAQENFARLKAMCAGMDVVVIVAGLGGGTGTGICPVLARAAREAGALALGLVLTPFTCERGRRQGLAQQGVSELRAAADGVVCVPNQRIFRMIDENTSLLDTFKIANEFLCQGLRGFWRLLNQQGLINIHFNELCAVMRDQHAESVITVVEARGSGRAREAGDKILAHPMLDGGLLLTEAGAVLVSVIGGPDLTMVEVDRVMEQINRQAESAQILMGVVVDEAFRDRMEVTVIVTRRAAAPPKPEIRPAPAEVETQSHDLLAPGVGRPAAPRQASRPAAEAGRPRKGATKLRQAQLALEIVSKGRFDQGEPNIHKGEDLDVPTYVRRGIALN